MVDYLDAAEVERRLDRGAVLPALRTAFAGLTTGASRQPAQTTMAYPGDAGDCIFYPGLITDLDVVGVKASPYTAGRAATGTGPVTAYTLLLSASTGEPRLLCDSLALTAIRTAATTALAVDLLAPDDASSLAVIGAGPVALEHLRFALPLRDWSDIAVFSPALADPRSPGHADRRAALAAVTSTAGTPVSVADSVEAAVSRRDVVLLCTSSSTPVADPELLESAGDVLVSAVGADGARGSEMEPSALPRWQVFCDYRATAPLTAGDFITAIERGDWEAADIVADLPELVTGAVAVRREGLRYFRSTGLGIEDLAVASLLG
jgi:L-arginine dehydrogenase